MEQQQCEKRAASAPAEKAPPEWQVAVRRITKDDGRYLIYYDFCPAPDTREDALQPAEEAAR